MVPHFGPLSADDGAHLESYSSRRLYKNLIWTVLDGPGQKKLKFLLDRVPPGFFVGSCWFDRYAIAKSAAHDYHRTGWLEHVQRGLYRRPLSSGQARDTDWRLTVLSAQWIMGHNFHVGAGTALALSGHLHDLALGGRKPLALYGDVPTWLLKLALDAEILVRRRQLFGTDPSGIDHRDFDLFSDEGNSPWRWPLKASSAEGAILELLNEVPGTVGFETVDHLFESLVSLRPKRIADLLGLCRSIKVKRLVLLFADRHGHAWARHLDRSGITLGSGPRMLVQGGQMNAAYQLVVPDAFARPRDEADHGA